MRSVFSCFLVIPFFLLFSVTTSGEITVSANFKSKLIVYEPLLNDSAFLKTKDPELLNRLILLFCKGDSVYLEGDLNKACKFYEGGLTLCSKFNLNTPKILFLNRLGFTNYWLANITNSINYYKQSERLFKDLNCIPDTLAYIETIYFNKIFSVTDYSAFDNKSEGLIRNIDPNNFKGSRLIKLHFLVSNIYFSIGDHSSMKKELNEMKASIINLNENQDFWLFLERLMETKYYMQMKVVEIEGSYVKQLNFQIKDQPKFKDYQYQINSLLAWYYSDINQFQKAIDLLEEIKPIVDKEHQPYFYDYYLLLGYCYYLANDRLKPKIAYKDAEKVLVNHKAYDSRLAMVYVCMAVYDINNELKPNDAIPYLKKSIKLLDHSANTGLKSYVYRKIADFYSTQLDFPKAIEYYSLQLNDLDKLLSDSIYFLSQIPRIIQNQIPIILKYRGNSYYYLAEKKNFDKKLLTEAYEEKRKLLILWMKLFDYLEGYEDYRINKLSSIREAYDDQIEFGYDLYKFTKDEEWLDRIFSLSQKSKVFLLKSFLSDRTAQNMSGIPEELVQKTLRLRKELDELQYSLNATNLLANSQTNNKWLMSIVIDKYSEYNRFIKGLEKKYPEYALLKKKVTILSAKQIQGRLDTNQALIEYQIGYAGLYTFYIDKENIKTFFYPVLNDAKGALANEILKYRDLILADPSGSCSPDNKQELADQSKFLYKLLIGPIEKYIKNKRLIIVPDRELNTIPFETLIDSSYNSSGIFSQLNIPYLIRKNPISYLYSSSLMENKMISTIRNPKFAGFAPDYNTTIPTGEINNSTLEVLPGALDELYAARKYFRGRIFSAGKATKENFFSCLTNYDIIHLAMHTLIDKNEPMNSELIFSPQISDKDRQLKAYEVYSHENIIKMAVLSACNTGTGKVRAGEGIFNIARAFFLAGVHNVILTQWSVSDKSSAELMKGFYKYLSEGEPTDIAIQKAKIDFLKKGDPVKMHPYYWSGYLTYGTCIFVPYKNRLYLIIIPAILIIGSIISIRKFRT